MTKQISFLLGSGFSVPDGVKTVGEINTQLQNLKLEDILITSDMNFIYLNGQQKPSISIRYFEEKFFIDFIKFYCDFVKTPFDYEAFYDFVMGYLRFDKNRTEITKFVANFNLQIQWQPHRQDAINNLYKFIEYFSKAISIMLQSKKYFENVTFKNYPPYDQLIYYLKFYLEQGTTFFVHTLNHDLLFEHIASKHSDLSDYFTDGFSEVGSNYYGYLSASGHESIKVKLPTFQDKFDKSLQLLKLHGSVDTYVANIFSDGDLTRLKRGWGIGSIVKEIANPQTGTVDYRETLQHPYPDILSGATSKAMWYRQPHYKAMLDRFKSNLNQSDKLFVIGYGFKDDGINHLLENEYLVDGKPMCVIDIKRPVSRLVNDYKVQFINKSIADLTFENWLTFSL